MTALDELLKHVPLATRKALPARAFNVLLHPATVPATITHGALAKLDAGPPGGGTPPVRVVAVLGPGATFDGLAALLLPLYARATGAKPLTADELAKGLVFYNRAVLPAGDWRHHRVGLHLPLPIEVEASGAWKLNADDVRKWAAAGSFDPAWRPRLSIPPDRLDVLEPARIDGDARALLAAPGTLAARAATLWERTLRNPSETVLTFLAVLGRVRSAGPDVALNFVLAPFASALPHHVALLATTSAGNGVLRCLRRAMAGPPPAGTDMAKLTAARTLVDNALFQGPAGARKLVRHREVPQTADLLALQPGVATTSEGAAADPAGGLHRIVLGRSVALGRPVFSGVGGATWNGPKFDGRVPLEPFLKADAAALAPPPVDAQRVGRLTLLDVFGVGGGRLDAVRAGDARFLTFGLGAWSASTPDVLATFLADFKNRAPDEFDLLFELHGLTVGPDPANPARQILMSVTDNGTPTPLPTAANVLRHFFGGTATGGDITFSGDWAARFRLAALVSHTYRRTQVLLAIGKLTHSALEIAIASVDPFPPKPYKLDLDTGTPLQTTVTADVNTFLTGVAATVRSRGTLSAALIDLTGAPARPPYARSHATDDEDTFNIGSMGKVLALYAAFELRYRLGLALAAAKVAHMDTTSVNWHVPFLATVDRIWAPQVAKGFPGLDTRMPGRMPTYTDMFTFTTAGGGSFDFTTGTATDAEIITLNLGAPLPTMRYLELLKSMIYMSNGTAAGRVIVAIDYPYLNGALREAGFFDPETRQGLWVSGSYHGQDWKRDADVMRLSARGTQHYKSLTNFSGNARDLARLLALADRKALFDPANPAACNQMIEIMRKYPRFAGDPFEHVDNSFIRMAIRAGGTTVDHAFSKIGIGVPGGVSSPLEGVHDCAVIERKKGPTTLRYVVVVMGGYRTGVDAGTFLAFIRALDAALAKVH